jgi:hypothetical protein
MWFNLFILVASYVISAALAPKPQKPKPAAFDDIEFPQFEEGTPQEVIFGDVWTESWMVLGVGNYRTEAIRAKGGKK